MTNPTGLPVAVTGELTTEPVERQLVFEMEIPIRWADMDLHKHVNNVVYFRYMEQVRISWLDALGVRPENLDEGPVVINAFCSFLQQLDYPGTILARLAVGQFGRSSVQTFVDISRTDDPDTIYAAGGGKVVWIDYDKRKSLAIPTPVRDLMGKPVNLLGSQ